MSTPRLIVGLLFILVALNILFDIDVFRFVIPAILIWLGVRIIWGKGGKAFDFERTSEMQEDSLDEVLVFSGINRKYKSSKFSGGKLAVVFGGGEVDLSEVKTDKNEIGMEVVAVFGGAKLIVPKDWKVRSQGVGIFGGYDNKASFGKGKTMLNIKGAAIFGGVEIVN